VGDRSPPSMWPARWRDGHELLAVDEGCARARASGGERFQIISLSFSWEMVASSDRLRWCCYSRCAGLMSLLTSRRRTWYSAHFTWKRAPERLLPLVDESLDLPGPRARPISGLNPEVVDVYSVMRRHS